MNSIKSVVPGRGRGEDERRAKAGMYSLCMDGVEPHFKCSWMGGLCGGECVQMSAEKCREGMVGGRKGGVCDEHIKVHSLFSERQDTD